MKLKKIIAGLLVLFCVAGFAGCKSEPESNSQKTQNGKSQSLNTALELKTATFMISDEWDVIDSSDKNKADEFENLVGAFNYVTVVNDDFFFAIEEYTIDKADSTDDVLLEEYVQRQESYIENVVYSEIGDENCAVLTYNKKEIVYCFVENSVHYKFCAVFNEDVSNDLPSDTIENVILTFDQHISSSEVLDEIAVSLDNKVDLDETVTIEDATFSVSSSWTKEESENNGYNWFANDLSFFQANAGDADTESETQYLASLYIAFKYRDDVTDCSDPEDIEIDGVNGITFSIVMSIENYGERTLKLYCVIFNGKIYTFGFTNVDKDSSEILDYESDIISSITFTTRSTTSETKVETELATETVTEKVTEPATEKITAYYSGTYKVGEDIPAGEYCIFSTENKRSGYYSVNADSNGDDIIGNDVFDYNAFVTISDGQYLELNRAKAIPVEEIGEIETNQSGMFRVGIDIPAGEYKIESTKNDMNGYYSIYNSSEPNASIVTNNLFDGQTYVTVSDGQYLSLERSRIIQ